MAKDVGGFVESFEEGRSDGFAVRFFAPDETTDTLIARSKVIVERGDTRVLESFLSGAFDGRSSFDRGEATGAKAKLVIDCPVEHEEDVASLIKILGVSVAGNAARDRLEGGDPRKLQLRMNVADSETFFTKIGLVSPAKLHRALAMYPEYPHLVEKDAVRLPGVQVLSADPSRDRSTAIEFFEDERLKNSVAGVAGVRSRNLEPKEKGILRTSQGATYYERSNRVSANALANSEYLCEVNGSHKTFAREKDGTPYLEPHHLVPMARQSSFEYSLDVEENVVALCSACHNEIHYGKEKKRLIEVLFDRRREALSRVGIDVTLDELFRMHEA